MRYHFETLPLHPQPARMESLTSYMTRLAEANYISQPATFFNLFWDRSQVLKRPADYPLASLGRLPVAAACAEADLLRTTFYYLGQKFSRSTDPRGIALFLQGCLSHTLRYCPYCVDEHSFYSLTWRFLHLAGCAAHGCRLIEHCSHCGQALPLFAAPLKIGICPTCKGDLLTCHVEPLTQSERLVTRMYAADLTFLLTPQPWESSSRNMLVSLGRQFAQLRRNKQLRQSDVDAELGVRSPLTRLLECGTVQGRSFLPNNHFAFHRYLMYADFFGVSFVNLFTVALAEETAGQSPRISEQKFRRKRYLYQAEVDKQVEHKLQTPGGAEVGSQPIPVESETVLSVERQRQQEPPTSVEQGISLPHGEAIRREAMREQEWLNQVQLAFQQLTARGERITITAICQTIPVAPGTLRRYPRIKAFLATIGQAKNYHAKRRMAQLREEALVAEVQNAIDQIKIRGQHVTDAAIAEIVHRPVFALRRSSSVRMLLDQVTAEEGRTKAILYQEELLKQMEETRCLLESRGQRVTEQTVGEILHLSISSLVSYYPGIKAFWQQVREERASKQEAKNENRDELLVEEAKKIINLLELRGEPITAAAISRLMGMSIVVLNRSRRMALLLDSVVQANRARKTS